MPLTAPGAIEEPVTTESLIRQAGLLDGPEFEERNGDIVGTALQHLRSTAPQPYREIVYNELAALHMPALVDAFKKQRAVNSAASHLLSTCVFRPHFVRYAQRPEAANLHKIHAKRLLANVWNEARIPFEFVLQNSLQLFSSLLVVWGTDFDRDVRARLVRQLRGWKNAYPDDPNVQMYVVRCLHLIRPMGVAGTEIQTLNLPYLRIVFAKGVASCNFPGCAELAENITLRACSRCKVYYCSANHQQQDWKKHKPFCITPAF